jgi:hypothetical protein
MSSYRSSYRRNAWPDREAEKREATRKAEAEQKRRMEMNATNFPTLSTVPVPEAPTGTRFAELAQKWAVDERIENQVSEYKKFQEAAERRETERIMAHRVRTRHAIYEDEEEEELQETTEPSRQLGIEDDVGWTEVKRKVYKPKREITVDEMDERERMRDEEYHDDEFNGHLLESNRHDHYRV